MTESGRMEDAAISAPKDWDPRTLVDGDLDESGVNTLIRWIFETSHLGIAVSSWNARWGWMNRRFSEMLGYSPEELKGKTWVELTHPADVEADMAQYDRMLAGELDGYELEKRFITASGGILSAHLKVCSARNPDGSLRFVWAYVQDMSDRRAIEQELRRRLDLERTLASVSARLVGPEDLDEAISSSLEEIGRLGRAGRAYLFLLRNGGPLLDNTHEWCAPGIRPQKDNLQGIPMDLAPELLGKMLEGEVFHLRHLDDLPDTAGAEREVYERQGIQSLLCLPVEVAGSFRGFVGFDNVEGPSKWSDADITLLRLFSKVLGGALQAQAAQDAIRFSQMRFREVIDLVPHLIFAKDEEGRFFLVNQAMADAYGTTIRGLLGKKDADFVDSPEEVRRFREDDLEVIRTGERKVTPEAPFTDAQGHLRVFRTVKIPFTFSGMASPSVLSVATEVTELLLAEARRIELERSLLNTQKLESLGILAGGIAHDFNNLLLAILGNLDLATNGLPPDSPALPLIKQAIQASRRATDLTRQMLAYSGRGSFSKSHMDLGDLVRENAELFRAAVGRNVYLKVELSGSPVPVEVDPGQVQQVVMNLITNAAEAIGDDSGLISISTGIENYSASDLSRSCVTERPDAGSFAFMEVRDSGGGMDGATRRRIFDPFFTTKFTGRGLGLAAVLGIVRGHKGAIFVNSAPGRGTTIRVLFPAAEPQTPAQSAEPGESASASGFSGSVLVADDEPQVLDLAVRLLEHLGFTTVSARDGAEAVALFRDHKEELTAVLLDLTMPHMDGTAALREIRRLSPEMPVLVCSGYNSPDTGEYLPGESRTGFIQKPYRLNDLRKSMSELLSPRE